jgi:hypothetical protein
LTLKHPTFPNSFAPTAFPIINASSNSAANRITALTSLPIAAYRLTVNSLSQTGAKVTLVALQDGIG